MLSARQKKNEILSGGRGHSSESLYFFIWHPSLKKKKKKHIREEEQTSENQEKKEDNRSRSKGIQLFELLGIVIKID